ncbi:MAG TPA: sulfite exporter TauE/SafE family protein [Candidatus Saccharimonadales bacterium]|nr:sulfite exporter TauE/SafE family protein [Candidatus Saccharimonadales bacterium]
MAEYTKKHTYFVEGMHCASCELLIEKKLLKNQGITKVKAFISQNRVEVAYTDELPSIDKLNEQFSEHGYIFSPTVIKTQINKKREFLQAFGIFSFIFIAFILIQKLNIGANISANASSSIGAFFMLGLVAGISSCAALVGGLLLSMTKKWNEIYIGDSAAVRSIPFLLFNIGRLISFAVLGGILGVIGGTLKISTNFSAFLSLAVAAVMVLIGLQMLGIKWASRFQIRIPKRFSGQITDENNFSGKFMPLVLGGLTFFIPCGFTLIAQGVALTSGSFIKGAIFMLFFALGTLPMLAAISFSSIKLNSKPAFTAKFNYAVGLLIIFFGVFSFNSQLNALGFKSLSDIKLPQKQKAVEAVPTRTIELTATGYQYLPRFFTVKQGLLTKLQILNVDAGGCANAAVGRGLFSGVLELHRGLNEIAFIPREKGDFKITCTMGMVPPVTVRVI